MRKVEITFRLSQKNADLLKELAGEVGIDKVSLFNNALTLFEWAIEEVKSGRVIASIDERNNKCKVIGLPILEAYASLGRTAREK